MTWLLHSGFLRVGTIFVEIRYNTALIFNAPDPLMWKLGGLAILYFPNSWKDLTSQLYGKHFDQGNLELLVGFRDPYFVASSLPESSIEQRYRGTRFPNKLWIGTSGYEICHSL